MLSHVRKVSEQASERACVNVNIHDDVIKWKHFPRYWPFVRRIHRSQANSPHKGQWRGALMFTLIRIDGWVNNREAGDLRRYRPHYDVIVMSMIHIVYYSIHVPGWLQKWLNLITAPGSVSNEPGSVTWLATKYLKTVSWRNHTENLTTLCLQNISFWPKINISSSYIYFNILMLNCLENTLKLQFDSYVTPVNFQNNLTGPNSNTAGIRSRF